MTTLAALLAETGADTPAGLSGDPSSLLVRVLDADREVQADLDVHHAETGDRYLLCSGSVWRSVPSPAISRVLAGASTPREAVDALIRTARPHEAYRSITCVVADLACRV